jgi:hypothetical protein
VRTVTESRFRWVAVAAEIKDFYERLLIPNDTTGAL